MEILAIFSSSSSGLSLISVNKIDDHVNSFRVCYFLAAYA